MKEENRILTVLEERRGQYVSGQALAEALGVSRNAVWKAVDRLRGAGYAIESVTRKGYRLAPDNRLLTVAGVAKHLRTAGFYTLTLEREVTSTNAVLKEKAAAGAPEGTVLLAHAQTAGRGRLGRSFYSPAGTGAYFSVLLRPSLPAHEAQCITTAAAVAVTLALEHRGIPAGIKWVNDVFVGGKKVCGILTEAALSMETGGLESAVLGIGLDLAPPAGGFPPDLAGVAGGIFDAPPDSDAAAALVADVLDGFADLYRDLRPERFLDRYRDRCFLLGQAVTFTTPTGPVTAVAEAIDRDFALLARAPDGTLHRLTAGEVTQTRPAAGSGVGENPPSFI